MRTDLIIEIEIVGGTVIIFANDILLSGDNNITYGYKFNRRANEYNVTCNKKRCVRIYWCAGCLVNDNII